MMSNKFKKYISKFDKCKILKLNKEGNNIKQISEIIGIPNRRLGEMCKYFNIDILSNFSIPIKHHYFDVVDTEAKAYILGYTIADGCVTITQRIKSKSYRLNYLSSINDSEVINLIRDEISPKSKITTELNSKGAKNRKPQLRLRFTSKKLVTDLIDNFDVIPNKTVLGGKFRLPKLDDVFTRHLIRGIFDGDGTVGNGMIQFSLNSRHLCNDLYNVIQKHIPELTHRIYEHDGKTCKYYTLCLNLGHGVKQKIYDYFYKDSKHFLSRKKNRF